MAFVPPARHLLRAKDLADARYFEPLSPRRRVRRGAEERPYGIDSSFRAPSGNHLRLTQVREMAVA
jgi:hypothetical protein